MAAVGAVGATGAEAAAGGVVKPQGLSGGSGVQTIPVANAQVNPAGSGPPAAPPSAKSFVGVSQVFNSLDDYRNNVKSLEVDAQLPSYDWQTEPEHEDDLNKFSEQPRNKILGETTVSSSESLTTSSCSTFSSGPSPVSNGSHSEELTTPPESDKPSALQVLPQDEVKDDVQENQQEQVTDQPQQEEIQEQELATPNMEDLAVGLSSISITASATESQSMLPGEVTASSVLGQVLQELSEESSSSTREPETEMTNGIEVPPPVAVSIS